MVQGVGFRAWAREKAQALGLHGWVRNLDDGDVAIWVQGPETLVEDFLREVRAPRQGARVSALSQSRVDPDPGLSGFHILR